ncbi:MAG: hypothetical protein FWD03_00770 [Defluviitaleaceae bacterium]|nr:hypothetical protein [Defluviitaleaceae bacterium]
MNKLEGFYELNRAGIPSVPWKEYDSALSLDNDVLWTVRSAVMSGQDLNLPRKIGVTAEEAKTFAESLKAKLNEYDLVLCYPFFIAEKSGVMEIAQDRVVIEAVKADLWNLVTFNNKDVTIIISNSDKLYVGDEKFIEDSELEELLSYSGKIKQRFRNIMLEGKSIFLEWSYAFVSDIKKMPIGEKHLIFYEIRSVV